MTKSPKKTARSRSTQRPSYPSLPISAFSRSELILPPGGPKDEQAFLEGRKALCLNPAFRADIQRLRQRYPESYWKDRDAWLQRACALSEKMRESCNAIADAFWKDFPHGPLTFHMPFAGLSFDSEVRALCEQWGFDGYRWVEWLVKHWDLAGEQIPSLLREPPGIRPVFDPWSISVVDRWPQEKSAGQRQVTIKLRPGVSGRGMERAGQEAVKRLDAHQKTKGVRPGHTDLDREAAWAAFTKLGIPARGQRVKMIQKVAKMMEDLGRPMSKASIGKLLRPWLSEQGQPVRRFRRAKRDARP